jgi:AcrR family transcriptional regulator
MSGPAIYRYYASRDELITSLIVDAYNDMSDHMEAGAGLRPQAGYGARILDVMLAYRQWAIQHPIDFQLIFGNPIPGYHGPEEATVPAARRGFGVILGLLAAAYQAGQLKPQAEHIQLPAGLKFGLAVSTGYEWDLPDVVVQLGLIGWTRIHGILTLEMFGHIQTLVNDIGLFYQQVCESLLRNIGLDP